MKLITENMEFISIDEADKVCHHLGILHEVETADSAEFCSTEILSLGAEMILCSRATSQGVHGMKFITALTQILQMQKVPRLKGDLAIASLLVAQFVSKQFQVSLYDSCRKSLANPAGHEKDADVLCEVERKYPAFQRHVKMGGFQRGLRFAAMCGGLR